MKRNLKKIFIGGIICTFIIVGLFYAKRWLDIDTCLDHGGRWNYQTNICEQADK